MSRWAARLRQIAFMLAAAATSPPAFAQAVGQTPARAAEDAFGTGIEGDAIGLYDADDARGASPIEAGNVRIEGLYAFIGEPSDRLSDASFVAVGPRALAAAHAAPSGVIDFFLRRVEDEGYTSVAASIEDRFSTTASVDAGWRGASPLSIVGGAEAAIVRRDRLGDDDYELDIAGAVHWDDADTRASVFAAHARNWDVEDPILYVTEEGTPPPQVPRRRSPHQPFIGNDEQRSLWGAIVSAPIWSRAHLKAGVFLGEASDDGIIRESFEIESADGAGRRVLNAFAPSDGSTLSGELRVERAIAGPRLNGIAFASLRGRRERSHAGGAAEAELDVDPVDLTHYGAEPRPEFDFEPAYDEAVDQELLGLGVKLAWLTRLEINVGLQHSWYRQRVRAENGLGVASEDRRMLGNVGAALRLAPGLRLYGGYVRGLEELGAAPFTAANANVALAASAATQQDLAIEWTPSDAFALVLGAFELRRPFADMDEADFYGVRGEERNRGLELSAVWRPDDDVSVILGAVSQEPRLVGANFTDKTVAPAQPTGRILLDADVAAPRIPGLFITLSAAHARGIRTNADNPHGLPAATEFDLGLRYEFEAGGAPMQIELTVENATDAYVWRGEGDNGFTFDDPRTVIVSLTADF